MGNRKELERELEKINNEISVELNNFRYMVNHINIENVNLIEFHYKFNDLFNKRKMLKDRLFDLKLNDN